MLEHFDIEWLKTDVNFWAIGTTYALVFLPWICAKLASEHTPDELL